MKYLSRFIILFLLSLSGITVMAQSETGVNIISNDLSIRPVCEDSWIIEHRFPWPSNSLLVKLGDVDFVLVDTPQDPSGSRDLLKWMKKTFRNFRLTVINTHFHTDNLGGNEVMIAAGHSVMGSDMIAPLLKERGERMRKNILAILKNWKHDEIDRFIDSYKSMTFVPPTLAFQVNNIVSIYIANENFEIFYPGPGHSPDNVTVYFRKKRLLFGGCLIKSLESNNLGNLVDANTEQWSESIDNVQHRYPIAKIIIPGHGKPDNQLLFEHTKSLLVNFHKR
ncbi:MBL fold metallo-hydrolase [bacterium]|nr:MBL fold metallo-hydrolase [bacterium]